MLESPPSSASRQVAAHIIHKIGQFHALLFATTRFRKVPINNANLSVGVNANIVRFEVPMMDTCTIGTMNDVDEFSSTISNMSRKHFIAIGTSYFCAADRSHHDFKLTPASDSSNAVVSVSGF